MNYVRHQHSVVVAVCLPVVLVISLWLPALESYSIPQQQSTPAIGSSFLIRPVVVAPGGNDGGKNLSQRKLAPQRQLFIPEERPAVGEPKSIEFTDYDEIDRSYRKVKKIVKHRRHPVVPRRIKPGLAHRKRRFNPHLYTPFTKWGPCDYHCHQKRERYCIAKRKCGNHVQTEERICPKSICVPLHIPSIPTVHIEEDKEEHHSPALPWNQFTIVNFDGHVQKQEQQVQERKKKKKKIIIQEDDDWDESDGDTDYVILKSPSSKYPSFHRKEEPLGKMVKGKPLLINLDDFDDKRILTPNYALAPHFDNGYETAAHKFVKYPRQRQQHQVPPRRYPSKLSDYFEDYYDHLYRDGTGFSNRKGEDYPDTGEQEDWRPIPGPVNGSSHHRTAMLDKNYGNIFRHTTEANVPKPLNVTSAQYQKLLESFSTASTGLEGRQAKREVDGSSSDFDSISEEDEERPTNGQLKSGGTPAATQRRAREKAVFEMPRKVENPYTKWSKWTKCTAKCTTRRLKRCRIPAFCGNDVIREIAYCYTEGSFCEEWIGNQLYQNSRNIVLPPAMPPTTTMKTTTTTTTTSTTTTTPRPNKPRRNPSNGWNRSDTVAMPNSISAQIFSNRRGTIQSEYMPQQIACGIPAEAFCGGTLVSSRWILTAAHCVRKRLFVRLGEHNLQQADGTEIEFRVELSIKHPRYDKKTVDNDVALLKLPREVEPSNFIGYACLPMRYQALPTGHTCTIIGWGKKRHNDEAGTDILHEAEVPIVPNERCRAVYHDYTITKNMFCAGHKRGRIDTCAGDSGGPLLCRDASKLNNPWTIYGITSFGDGCGKQNKFGIYTKVPNYVDWVWSVINCDGNCRT
ncbi:AGAP006120-PA-like protein [Anopheles sinensis]|uniref:limulus clotting factor C n=1 Tax=Anopheles sinensis TaxID=74873 RepID=A0A084VW61_ANOSI|nr:AGAP006120-PA-like protein [Anopheles sinensis]